MQWMSAALVVQEGTPVLRDLLALFDSGVGILLILAAVAVHTAMASRWAGRMESHIADARAEIRSLRESRHKLAGEMTRFEGRLDEGHHRMLGHSEDIRSLRDDVNRLTRMDARLESIGDRLTKIEDKMDQNNGVGGGNGAV